MDAYCEAEDVRKVLQEATLSGPIDSALVEPAVQGVSTWLRKQSGRHWYDSGGGTTLVGATTRTATNVRLDVPSSPHSQRDQVFVADRHGVDVRYPVTSDGPYARLPLPHAYVDSLQALRVRDSAGGTTDWVSDPEFAAGVGEDYYLREEDQEGHGESALYVRAASIGARTDFGGLVVADYDYGLDEQTESWEDVRRGVAAVAAAQLVVEDDVLTALPDDGQLVGVDSQAESLLERGRALLRPYLPGGVI